MPLTEFPSRGANFYKVIKCYIFGFWRFWDIRQQPHIWFGWKKCGGLGFKELDVLSLCSGCPAPMLANWGTSDSGRNQGGGNVKFMCGINWACNTWQSLQVGPWNPQNEQITLVKLLWELFLAWEKLGLGLLSEWRELLSTNGREWFLKLFNLLENSVFSWKHLFFCLGQYVLFWTLCHKIPTNQPKIKFIPLF